nr:uncharacterized protein LOC109424889 [Aedes albopictus]
MKRKHSADIERLLYFLNLASQFPTAVKKAKTGVIIGLPNDRISLSFFDSAVGLSHQRNLMDLVSTEVSGGRETTGGIRLQTFIRRKLMSVILFGRLIGKVHRKKFSIAIRRTERTCSSV